MKLAHSQLVRLKLYFHSFVAITKSKFTLLLEKMKTLVPTVKEGENDKLLHFQLARLFCCYWLVRCIRRKRGSNVGLKPLYSLFYEDFVAFRKALFLDTRYVQCYELFYSELEYLINENAFRISWEDSSEKSTNRFSEERWDKEEEQVEISHPNYDRFHELLVNHNGLTFLQDFCFDYKEIETFKELAQYFLQRPRPYYNKMRFQLNFIARTLSNANSPYKHLYDCDTTGIDQWY